MPSLQFFPIRMCRPIAIGVAFAATVSLAVAGKVPASTPRHALQGLFCNDAAQIDEAVRSMRRGLPPRAAAALVNRDRVVCTFVDVLHYIVEHPVVIREAAGSFPLLEYEGTLVAVVVGGAVRPVTPPVRIFFAIPERLAGAVQEGRA